MLLAIVDAKYKFVVADIGGDGSSSDGGLWKASEFGKSFDSGQIPVPAPKLFPNSKIISPYVMVGDEAFQLRQNFMRPFPGKQLNESRRIYNYRHSRAR